MLHRVLWFILIFPAAVLLVTLAVTNRHSVRLVLDPFRPNHPVLSVEMPFYIYLLGMLLLGMIIGGLVTWFSQGRWRRTARRAAADARRWQAEADRLDREHQKQLAASRQLAPAGQ